MEMSQKEESILTLLKELSEKEEKVLKMYFGLEGKPKNTLEEKKSNKYLEGISCPKCHDQLTESQKERFTMRQKQILIAKKMGKKYIFQKEFS